MCKAPLTSAIPTLPLTQKVEGQDVSDNTCSDNQRRHCPGHERYKRCTLVANYTSSTVAALSVMHIVATDATWQRGGMHFQAPSVIEEWWVAISPQ